MFIADSFIYLQLQKTACTHIASILSNLFEGVQVGKHNALTENMLLRNRLILSSIRNPWEWYLSLWLYGVSGRGGLWQRLTNSNVNGVGQEKIWKNLYANDDVTLFRKWLKLIHNPCTALQLNDEYGNVSGLSDSAGFFTYRYMRLCWEEGVESCSSVFDSSNILFESDLRLCHVDFFIRQEQLELDLISILSNIRPLNLTEKEFILNAGKSNVSLRKHTLSEYYNLDSVRLVMSRDQLLIDKFSYIPPVIKVSS